MSFSDDVQAWLAEDITGHVERMAFLARVAERRIGWDRHRLVISSRYVDIHDCVPSDLREIADHHDATAAELKEHAAELREYADDLEHGSCLGTQLDEHFRAMRESRARGNAERDHALGIARAEGGVIARFGNNIGFRLSCARILTVDDVRDALAAGRIMRVNGIGPARFAQITRDLARDAPPSR